MKKIFFLLLGSLIMGAAFSAENKVLLKEEFNGQSFAGWTNSFPAGIIVNGTNIAGGEKNEAVCVYDPGQGFRTELEGYAYLTKNSTISTKGYESIFVSFIYQYEVAVSTNKSFGMGMRVKGQTEWIPVISKSLLATTSAPELALAKVPASLLDKDSVEVCFFMNSPLVDNKTYVIFFDNIMIDAVATTQANIDLKMSPYSGSSVAIKGSLTNMGLPLKSCEVSYVIGGNSTIYSKMLTFEDSIGFRESAKLLVDHDQSVLPGKHIVKAWFSKINGSNLVTGSTDTAKTTVTVGTNSVPYRNLMEHFTSSTCGPCRSLATAVYDKLYPQIMDKMTVIKYQMNFPGSGDPYYIADCGSRFSFYKFNAVPSQAFNGSTFNSTWSYKGDSTVLNDAINSGDQSCFNIDVKSANVGGTGKVVIDFDVKAYTDAPNTKLFVAVYEKETFNNKSNNGETSFHNVVMKMLPNGSGTTAQYKADSTYSYSFSYDMSTTNVEEFEDLAVAIFIQDIANKNFILQSTTAPIVKRNVFTASVGDVHLPSVIGGLQIPITGFVYNGGKDLSSFEVCYGVNGAVVSKTYEANLKAFENSFIDFTNFMAPALGKYTIKMWVSKINGNAAEFVDTLTKEITCVESDVTYMPLLEEFSSANSDPCVPMNNEVVGPLFEDFAGKMNLIKYPMAGDAYYQPSNLNRAKKYKATSVPSLVFKGKYVKPDSLSVLSEMLRAQVESYSETKSIVQISPEFVAIHGERGKSILQGKITVDFKVDGAYRLYCALVEKETTENAGRNGEVVFFQQNLKTVGGDNGVDMRISGLIPYVYEFSLNPGGFIEDFSDLVFVAYVVDESTSERFVLQSAQFDVENRLAVNEENSVGQVEIYPNPAKEKVTIEISEMSDINIYDALGKLVYSKPNVSQNIEVNVNSFAKGTYSVRVVTGSKLRVSKLSVIK